MANSPGRGVVIQDVGRIEYVGEQEDIVFLAGQHHVPEGPEAEAVFCAALALGRLRALAVGLLMRTDDEIRALLSRLSRRHSSGGTVIERATIMAEGADSAAVVTWILDHEGASRGSRRQVVEGRAAWQPAERSDRVRPSARPLATCCPPARSPN